MNADEPSTHRMSADEVRALIRQLEPSPPPHAGNLRSELTTEREPPTLLYRRARRVAAAVTEPRTLMGLGGARHLWTRTTTADDVANQVSREAPSGVDAGHERSACPRVSAPSAALRSKGAVPRASEKWRRRTRLVVASIVMLMATAPLLMHLVRARDAPPRLADARRAARSDAADERATVSARAGLTSSFARALENGVTQNADGATQQRMDDVRRATELMVMGDSAGALTAFRVLSRGWPEHLALAHVVRVLEQRLRTCAAQGGAACR